MPIQIVLILILTFLINLIATLSYSIRIVGIRTGKVATTFSLFNILVLISRTANGFQAPLLASVIENNINNGSNANLFEFRLIIFFCSLATVVGGCLIPTFQRMLTTFVNKFSEYKSMPKLILHSFSWRGIRIARQSLTIPNSSNLLDTKFYYPFPIKIFIMNVLAVAVITVGVLSSLYAGYLNPEFRTTASNLSGIINGVSTILMFIFIDPYLAILTDEVISGKMSESTFRKNIIYMVLARLIGTFLAQLIFIPSARILAWIAGGI